MRRFYKNNAKYLEATQVCRAYVDGFVDDVLAAKKSGAGAGGQPLQSNETKPSKTSFLRDIAMVIDDKDKIRGELLSLLLAGRDTTAALLSNLVYQFARRPDVWSKLQEEAKLFDGQLPTYQGLRNLKYAKYCINEGEVLNLETSLGRYPANKDHSPSIVPSRRGECQGRRSRYGAPAWWRTRWECPCICSQGAKSSILVLCITAQ